MNCQDFDSMLGRYVYRSVIPKGHPASLSAAEITSMDEHLRTCTRCADRARPLLMRLCREVIDTIADYLDGTMTPAERNNFEVHISVCPACTAYIESYKHTMALERAAFRDKAATPDSIPEDLIRAVLAARRKPDPR